MSVEKGIIAPNLNLEKFNPAIDPLSMNIAVPTAAMPWPKNAVRRASVNNFGYGGTSAHVILDAYVRPRPSSRFSLHCSGQNTKSKDVGNARSSIIPKMVMLSSKHEQGVADMRKRLAEYLRGHTDNLELDDLAYTLDERRTKFEWRSAELASTIPDLVAALKSSPDRQPTQCKDVPRLTYVFTGQGAQWHAMGRELLEYPVFANSMHAAERILQNLGATWSLADELGKDESSSRVYEPAFAQPLCVILQLCLVDLLTSWGISPSAVVSHSSGEIAAAYAAGILDFLQAIGVVYYRGVLTDRLLNSATSKEGAMLAVGLGPADVEQYLSVPDTGCGVIACVNSPSNVTLSGDSHAIGTIEKKCITDGVFARKLRTGAAYHSHHMEPMAADYSKHLQELLGTTTSRPIPGIIYGSPVVGGVVEALSADNWVANLLQPVLFSDALASVANMAVQPEGYSTTQIYLEIGPHGALAGPIKQTLESIGQGPDVAKILSILTRGKSALATAQETIARLACQGVPINYSAFNNPEARSESRCVVADLPAYPWNHSVAYWRAPRSTTIRAHRDQARHPLLGTRIMDANASGYVWRNFLQVAELPWLQDHIVQSSMVFPATGSVSMAMEAVRQIEGQFAVADFCLRDIELLSALLLVDDSKGTEVQFSLRPCSSTDLDDAGWWEFQLHSIGGVDDTPRLQSRGFVSCKESKPVIAKSTSLVYLAPTPLPMTASELYKIIHGRGIEFGPSFRLVQTVRAGAGTAKTVFSPCQMEEKTSMSGVHPATLDVVLHSAYAALDESSHPGSALLPRSIGSLYVSGAMTSYRSEDLLEAAVEITGQNQRGFYSKVHVGRPDGSPDDQALVELDGLFMQSMGASSASADNSVTAKKCFSSEWHPDWTMMSRDAFAQSLKRIHEPEDVSIAEGLNRATFHLIGDLEACLSDAAIDNMESHHQLWYEWMLGQRASAMRGEMAPGSEDWVHLDETSKQALYQSVEESSVEGRMLVRIGRQIIPILRRDITPLEIMMQDDLLSALYTDSHACRRAGTQVKEIMQHYRRKMPASKILEVGGGTGGCTQAVLAGLTQESPTKQVCVSRYDFTDISAGFLQRASECLGDYAQHMTFSTLDIEKDPISQGFEASSYDLVIAFQVLHATKDMSNTLSNVHRLLKPGGKLLLIETTTDTAAIQFIYGSLPDWWLGREDERVQSPNMPLSVWERILPQNRFSGLDYVVADCDDTKLATASVIISTALSSTAPKLGGQVSIIWPSATHPAAQSWLQDFRTSMSTRLHIDSVVETIDSYDANSQKQCIVFLEAFQPVLSQLTARPFYQLRKLLTKSKSVLWITKGSVMDGAVPEMGMIAGLIRTLRHETSRVQYVTLDLEAHAGWTSEISQAILKVTQAVLAEDVDSSAIESQYAMKGAELHISRVYQHDQKSLSKTCSSAAESLDLNTSSTPFKMTVSSLGLLDSLSFARNLAMEDEPLQSGELEIEPKAFGLNFRDVLIALGQIDGQYLGYECSGIVKRVGADCDPTQVKVADRVCCMIQGSFGNIVRTDRNAVMRIPDAMGFVEAASIPLVFITAYYSLIDVARLEKGESVLIHAGSGGVGQAAVQLAQHLGAEVFVTAGTSEKREFLQNRFGIADSHIFDSRSATFREGVMSSTGGRGVDVVLNSLSGPLLKASWACVAPLGRFIEIGKRDIETRKGLDMTPFRNGITFAAIDLMHLFKHRSNKIKRALNEIMKLRIGGSIQEVHPIRQYPMSEAPAAFRALQGGKFMGKTVLVVRPCDLVPVRPQEVRMRFAVNATYVIVGGACGIGASLARYMAQRKCRNLMLISRNATCKPESRQLEQDLVNLGCRVAFLDCDVADSCQLRKSIQSCIDQGFPPVKGVVHAAVALNDSIFEHMTWQKWQSCLKAKIDGTWNLHHALPKLDFFILLSSILGIVGNSSQGNYTAASAFQDSFARHRRSLGLPTISLDIGPTLGSGIVSSTTEVQDRLAAKGFDLVELQSVMGTIEHAMWSCCESIEYPEVMSGLRTFDSTSNAVFKHDCRFSALEKHDIQAERTGSRQHRTSGVTDSFKQDIAIAKTMADAVALCVDALVQQVASIIAVAIQSINPHKPLATYGIDSLVAVEIRNWLSTAFRADLTVFEVMQSQDLWTLARKTAESSKIVRDAGLIAPV